MTQNAQFMDYYQLVSSESSFTPRSLFVLCLILVTQPCGKCSLGRPKSKWEDNCSWEHFFVMAKI